MEEFRFLEHLKERYKNYSEMIDWCTSGCLILNNEIINILPKLNMNYEIYTSNYEDIDDNDMDNREIFQYFIITESGADYLSRFTNEEVIYIEELDMYLLCVYHFGTPWKGVPANWRDKVKD